MSYAVSISSISAVASSVYDAALALVYPQACGVCGASVERRAWGAACARCWGETRIFCGDEAVCAKCGRLAEGSAAKELRAGDARRCRRCEPDAFTAARACGVYERALRASVLAIKREPFVPAHLLRLMLETQSRPPLNQATRIVPVPLHPSRMRERGFNQAAVMGRELARCSRLEFDDESLARVSQTERHRAGMDARARRESVRGAFKVTRPRLLMDQSVLLVDDVFTTGATVSACAESLLDAGARQVLVLTIARPLTGD